MVRLETLNRGFKFERAYAQLSEATDCVETPRQTTTLSNTIHSKDIASHFCVGYAYTRGP